MVGELHDKLCVHVGDLKLMNDTQTLVCRPPAKKVSCVVGKCPHSAGEVPNVVLFIRLTPTVMFAMGSFCPTGHLCSCMFEWPFVGPFGGLSTREHSLQEK